MHYLQQIGHRIFSTYWEELVPLWLCCIYSCRTDIVRVALYNLTMREKQKNSSKRYFQYKDEICSYIDKHWDSLCHEKTSIVCTKNNQLGTKTWENTIGSALSTKSNYFKSGADSVGSAGYWGLRHEEDPVLVKESAIKAAPKNVNKEKKKKGLSSPSSSKSGKRKEEVIGYLSHLTNYCCRSSSANLSLFPRSSSIHVNISVRVVVTILTVVNRLQILQVH